MIYSLGGVKVGSGKEGLQRDLPGFKTTRKKPATRLLFFPKGGCKKGASRMFYELQTPEGRAPYALKPSPLRATRGP